MTDLLINIFIKDKNIKDTKVRSKYGTLSSITGIIVNCKSNNRYNCKFNVNNFRWIK